MENIATLTFNEVDSGEQCSMIVRASPGMLGLALSRQKDGDIEVFLRPQELEHLLSALRRAENICSGRSGGSPG